MNKIVIQCMNFLLISFIPLFSNAQNESNSRSLNQKDLMISTSLSYARYRDFATSPLFYQGSGTNLYMGWQTRNENSEFILGLDFLFNLTLVNAPKSDFFEVSTQSIFSGLQGNFTYLRNLKQTKSEHYDLKVGGTLIGNQNMRINPSLDNSSTGLESIINLMLSGKVERDISRRKESVSKFLFLSIQNKPVRRMLAFQSDVGVLNFNRRPSYNFAYTSPIDGTNTSMFSYVWNYYSWSMNGWRLRSKLEFTQFNSSGNGHRVGYAWDAMHAPGKYAAYQMGMHRIEYTILINNNR